MSAAYSDFFASGLTNHPSRANRTRFMSMSLDIPTGVVASESCSSSPTIDSPLLRLEGSVDANVDPDSTPTTAHTVSPGVSTPKAQGRILRKRRSSLSLAVGVQGNASAIKNPARAVQVSRARSGSTASTTSPSMTDSASRTGRGRSGSIGSALKSSKRRSMRVGGLAPPLPPPKSPLPDLPSFQTILADNMPGSAPPDVTSFQSVSLRSPLTARSLSQYQGTTAYYLDGAAALKSSPIRDTFDFHEQMKEN